MDTDAFERLSRLFGVASTRRAALSALLGTALMAPALETAAAKGKRKGKQRNQTRRKNNGDASEQTKTENHCLTPSGLDLNAFLGISEAVVASFCPEVGSGERWTTSGPWFVNGHFATAPAGFVPAFANATPVEDFQAKFTALKLVVDPGSRQEKTVVFPSTGNVFAGPGNAILPGIPEEVLVLLPASLGTVQPLSMGKHVVHGSWIFSAMHCDGFGADTTPGSGNCFPAGETLLLQLPFEVTPGHR
jgi:hypothetical protein